MPTSSTVGARPGTALTAARQRHPRYDENASRARDTCSETRQRTAAAKGWAQMMNALARYQPLATGLLVFPC